MDGRDAEALRRLSVEVPIEPLSVVAFLLGGVAGIVGLAWRKFHIPRRKASA